MNRKWNPNDPSTHWDIERRLRAVFNGSKFRFYGGVFKGSVEDVHVHTDGTAEVDMYGQINNNPSESYCFTLMIYRDRSFTVQDCRKK